MDVGWVYDGSLYLLELSSRGIYRREISKRELDNASDDTKIDYFTDFLINKATDSLLTLSAIWVNSDKGNELRNDYPEGLQSFNNIDSINIYFLIRAESALIAAFNDSFRGKFRGKLLLFDSANNGVMTIDNARELLPGIAITI